jgi:hypothetical protein
MVEVELLAASLLERVRDDAGRETVRVSDAGVRVLAATLQKNRAARDGHEALVARIALEMQRAGRIVWRGLTLRAPVVDECGVTRWALSMPDVFSIRHTSVEDYAEPMVHEIKVRRADFLSDLRRESKGRAYLALSSQCWYVIGEEVGTCDEVPDSYGVMLARPGSLEVLRPAPRRPSRVSFSIWVALARANAERAWQDDAQASLGDVADPP